MGQQHHKIREPARPGWRKKLLFAPIAVLGSLLLLALLAEIGIRVKKGRLFDFGDARVAVRNGFDDLQRHQVGHQYDPLLGTSPIPDFEGIIDVGWDIPPFQASIDRWGFRRHNQGDTLGKTNPGILAVGDSYTFGMEVDDNQTWPAELEQRLGKRVFNGGVMGYGIDQAILRMEQFLSNAESPDTDTVLLAMIADDVKRCAYGVYGTPKPYFTLAGDDLVLKNVPPKDADIPPPPLQNLLGRSYLADALFRRLAPIWWSTGARVRMHNREVVVAELLLQRFQKVAASAGCDPIVILLHDNLNYGDAELLDSLRIIAEDIDLKLIDLMKEQKDLYAKSSEMLRSHYQVYHYSAEGNRWIGKRIAEHLSE